MVGPPGKVGAPPLECPGSARVSRAGAYSGARVRTTHARRVRSQAGAPGDTGHKSRLLLSFEVVDILAVYKSQ
jgi:hypothetical protein